MRRIMLIANSAIAIFFVAFFAYTFLGRRHLDHLARDFVTSKTQTYADPIVDFAEETLKTPVVRGLLTAELLGELEREIAEYNRQPADYIGDLTGKQVAVVAQHAKNVQNSVVAKLWQWKQSIRDYYNKILARLFIDLRIFAGSNVVAAIVATWLAYRAPEKLNKISWLSFLLFAAVIYSIYMYVDSLSFFTILFNTYMGWWYPALMAITFMSLFIEYGRVVESHHDDAIPVPMKAQTIS